ncbi:MAG: molybdopterin molybdotransferase MoeA [Chthoniobacterales bacterium]
MIAETEALARILAAVEPLPAERLPVTIAAGRFTAEAVHSSATLPRFDQSAMDGYAVRAADTPGELRVTGTQPAGAALPLHVGEREAVRIFTGAPLPSGADAVVMQEDVVSADGGIRIAEAAPPGEFIRRRGEDVCEGQQLIAGGESLTAARIGLLCAAGIDSISVHARPRVAIITTGDELRPIGEPLAKGELHDSNGPMLAAQLAPVAEILGTAHCGDDPAALADTLRKFATADAIVMSAGVSVGDHDPVHEALRQIGARVELWRVAVKPGKPFLHARLGAQHIFGLPGNPVSTFVTAQIFVRPALTRMAGSANPRPAALRIPLGTAVGNPSDRVLYIRAALREGRAFPAPLQQSHGLASLAASDLLLRLEPGATCAAKDFVTALLLNFELTEVFNKN